MAVGDTKFVYKFPDGTHNMADTLGDAIKNAGQLDVDELLKMPAFQFMVDHAEELSEFIFDKYDNIEKSEIAIKKGKPTSGASSAFKALSTLAGAYNDLLPPMHSNASINRKPLDNISKKHTATTAPKRLLGGVPTRLIKGSHGLEIFEAIIERTDEEAAKHLKVIERITNSTNISSDDLKALGSAKTALHRLDAGKDLVFMLISTGGRVSEPLSLLTFDYSNSPSSSANTKRSIFAVVPEYENKGSRFEEPSGKVIGKSYRIYYPPKVTKMRTGLGYEVGPTIGSILEKRAEIARKTGSRQLFSYPVISYAMPKGLAKGETISSIDEATELARASKAYEYGINKKTGALTYGTKSDIPSYLVGTNGILSKIPDKDKYGNIKLDSNGNIKYLPLVFNEALQESEDYFTMHNLRQSFSTYARRFAQEQQALKGKPAGYWTIPAVFQSRIKDAIGNSAEAAYYFMFGLLDESEHLAEFNEEFTSQFLLNKMNSPRVNKHFDDARGFKLDLSSSSWKNIGGTGEIPPEPKFSKAQQKKLDVEATKKVDLFKGRMPSSIEALKRSNELGKVRQYLKTVKALENDPNNKDLLYKKQTLEAEGTELLKKSAKGGSAGLPGKGTSITGKDLSLLGKAGKGAGKALPFVGAGIGIGLATSAMAKDASEFAKSEDESNVVSQMRQLGRAGAELASGVSPIPLDASLLNLLPGEKFLDRGYRTLGEIVAPTQEERKIHEQRQQDDERDKNHYETNLSSLEDDMSTKKDKVDDQMGDLLSPIFY